MKIMIFCCSQRIHTHRPMSMDTLGATKNHDFHAFTPTVSNIRPTSRGHVSIVDKDSRTYAKIKQNYLSTDHDRMIAAAIILS